MRKIIYFFIFILGEFALHSQDLQLIIPLGHSRRVVDMDVSSDKKWLASIDGSSQVKIWDYQSGKEVYQLNGHDNAVSALDYHSAKPHLVTASQGELIIWDNNGLPVKKHLLEDKSRVEAIRYHKDSILIIQGSNLRLIDPESGNDVENINLNDQVAASLDLNDQLAVTGTQSGKLMIVDLASFKIIKELTISDVRIATVALAGNKAYAGTDKGELFQVNLDNDQMLNSNPFAIRNYKVLAKSDLLIACGRDPQNNIKQFNTSDLKESNSAIHFNISPDEESYQFGLRAISWSSDTTFLIADYDQNIREWNLSTNQWVERQFTGLAAPVYDLSINPSEDQLAIASGHPFIQLINLKGLQKDKVIEGFTMGCRSLDFHPVNPVIASFSLDNAIRIHNTISFEEHFNLKAKGDYVTTPTSFDPTGRYILRKSSAESFDFYDFKNKKPQSLKVKNGTDYKFSPNGRLLYFKAQNGIRIYDPITVKESGYIKIEKLKDFDFISNECFVALLNDGRTLSFYSTRDKAKTHEVVFPEEAHSDRIKWCGKNLIGWRNSIKRGSTTPDFTIKVFNLDGKFEKLLSGHSGFLTDAELVSEQYLFTASTDGLIKIWDFKSKQPYKGNLIPLDRGNYVVTTPIGLFDATPEAMNQLHYVKAGKVIALEQLKDEYYEPNLLSKILGYNNEKLRTTAAIDNLGLYPELNINHPLKNDGKLGINLENNGGGIGRIVILINGKEVSSDVRAAGTSQPDQSSMEVNYDIEGHPFLYTDRVNKVSVKAYNADGTLSSEAKSIYLFGEERSVEKPKLYAVIAGTSDYEGDALDLKYAAKDAEDFANAIQLSGAKYLGDENVDITLLTTNQESGQWPTKANIASAFQKYSQEATAKDLLLVYMSGHGVNHQGAGSDFYYLTCKTADGNLNNKNTRTEAAISSAELTEYIKKVPALKQILIIDACHSGRLASSLATARSTMSSTQIRALERMKDRTGMFVLAGSAADAVSYETTLFGQGLLTYSLLFGMKGAALRDDEFIDVIQLFQFAADKVPELAQEIGGVQKPEVRLPVDGKSFDIGRLEHSDKDKINIKAPKPVFVHTRFQDQSAIYDHLDLSDLTDQKLLEMSRKNDSKIVFVDDKNFSSAYSIHGRYEENNGLLNATITLIKDDEKIEAFNLEAVNAQILTDQIIENIITIIDK